MNTIMADVNLQRKLKNFGIGAGFHKELDNFHYAEIIEDERLESIYRWCESILGDNWIWSNPLHSDYVRIWFKYEYDALAFKLKFSII